MDDKNFQVLLLDSQVLATKDQTKWSFDILQDLIEGPLLNPKRMEEAIKASRYMKKLISFFHPFAHRFSDLSKSKSNMRWVKLGCMLMNTLLSSPEGIRFLGEDEFMGQIMKCFAQLDPVSVSSLRPTSRSHFVSIAQRHSNARLPILKETCSGHAHVRLF